MERDQRRRLREIQKRRGQNVNHSPEVRAAWAACRTLSLAYLDLVIARHAAGGEGAVPGWGKHGGLSPPEQVARQDLDYHDWARHMEDTPWFPGRTLGDGALEALESEIFSAWGNYAFQARLAEEPTNCAGFDVERARLFKAGATAVGFRDQDELAELSEGGVDLSGTEVEVVLPPQALRVLGADWPRRNHLPKVELRTTLIPDWEYPGYWLIKNNRAVSAAALADLLADRRTVSALQIAALRGELALDEFHARSAAGS